MDDHTLKTSTLGLTLFTEPESAKRTGTRLTNARPQSAEEMLRIIPSMQGPERLATAVDRIDRRVVDELLHLYGQLRQRTRERTPVIQVAGVTGGEGASTISALLARIVADLNHNAVLLFSDYQPPGDEKPACTPPPPTVVNVDAKPAADAVDVHVFVCPVSAVPSVLRARDPARPSAAELIETLRGMFALILIDAGPVMGSIDNLRDVRSVDGVLLVTCANQTSATEAQSAVKRLVGAGGNILGTIVNRERQVVPSILLPRK